MHCVIRATSDPGSGLVTWRVAMQLVTLANRMTSHVTMFAEKLVSLLERIRFCRKSHISRIVHGRLSTDGPLPLSWATKETTL